MNHRQILNDKYINNNAIATRILITALQLYIKYICVTVHENPTLF